VSCREKNLTQERLAQRPGLRRSTVVKIESRERRIDVAEFMAIAGALKKGPSQTNTAQHHFTLLASCGITASAWSVADSVEYL
jgi:transcriptional regulator with XRE-family HTH domain